MDSMHKEYSEKSGKVNNAAILGICKVAVVQCLIIGTAISEGKKSHGIGQIYDLYFQRLAKFDRVPLVAHYTENCKNLEYNLLLNDFIAELVDDSSTIVRKTSSEPADGGDVIGEWCFGMLKQVLSVHNEPLLNLHFLGPYMKDSQASIGCYDSIFEILPLLPEISASKFIQ